MISQAEQEEPTLDPDFNYMLDEYCELAVLTMHRWYSRFIKELSQAERDGG